MKFQGIVTTLRNGKPDSLLPEQVESLDSFHTIEANTAREAAQVIAEEVFSTEVEENMTSPDEPVKTYLVGLREFSLADIGDLSRDWTWYRVQRECHVDWLTGCFPVEGVEITVQEDPH